MQFKDKEAWDKAVETNKVDRYSFAVVTYAERWMNLMEKGLETGLELKDIWEDCSFKADTEGITGAMYGMAASLVAQVWEHGDSLRLLHNAKYGVHNSKGTVNPAIITIDVPEGKDPAEYIKERAEAVGLKVMSEKELKEYMERSKDGSTKVHKTD